MSFVVRSARRLAGVPLRLLILVGLVASQLPAAFAVSAADTTVPDHLVISEIVTGGASASDELIELYNPTDAALPLEGLELIYVSASGATVSRRAAWELGAPAVPAGGHVLVANAGGIFATIADATYASGMAATGGSVAVRILGATSAIDALGWGSAVGAWLEGAPATAPTAAASLERLPGAAAGSWRDTDDNAADFAERPLPEPQNLSSVPTPPLEPPAPTPTPQPPEPTPAPTPPPASVTAIAEARQLADGVSVTVEGLALTGSDFHDGGGFVADSSGGIAAIVTGGSFVRGERLRLTGVLDDRFAQRTLRVDGGGLAILGAAADPTAAAASTGSVGEAVEGTLVRVAGSIVGGASELTTGITFDLDDGSGTSRLVIATATGIDTSAWTSGTTVETVGVVGQRDSTGGGSTGYRVMPRDATDLLAVAAPAATPTAVPATPGASASPSDGASGGVVSIAQARLAPRNARVIVRGVVTLAPGTVDADTAVLQDATGAIVLRLGGGAGSLRLGQQVEASGTRSTKSGMETLRVSDPIRVLGSPGLPAASATRSGDAGEAQEAQLLVVRGALAATARRAASGSVTFDIDDGSGPLKVALGASLAADTSALRAGTWVEVRGVLGQQTTGAQPRAGYRLWPATLAAVRVVAPAAGGEPGDAGSGQGGAGTADPPPTADLGDLGEPDLADLRVGATLVVGPWPELGVGGLLWDGSSVVAIDPGSAELVAAILDRRRPPIALALGGLAPAGPAPGSGLPLLTLSSEPGDVVAGSGLVAAPRTTLAPAPGWVSVIGRLTRRQDASFLRVRTTLVRVDVRCHDDPGPTRGLVSVTGIAFSAPTRLVVPCGGVRRVPLLDRVVAPAVVSSTHGARGVTPADEPRTERRPLAAGLLLAGATGLAVAAARVRVRGRRWGPEGGGLAPERPGEAEPGSEPPRLTLVSVPREHGP